MLDNLEKYKVILASGSPRRRELMAGLGVNYEVRILPDVDESYPDTLQGEEIPLYIAKEKADAYIPMMQPDELIITADTIVWLDGEVLGKPRHRSFTAQTEVRFATLSEDEIIYYVDNFKPMDKAGAYGVQEWIGFIGVENISGSYYNIMGLPVQKLYRELLKV